MCIILINPIYPQKADYTFSIKELENLTVSTIDTLADVVITSEQIKYKIRDSKLYKIYVIAKSNNDYVDFIVVIRNPDGSLQVAEIQQSVEKEKCPTSLVETLEEAGTKEQVIDGCPAVTIIFPKDVSEYIIKMARLNKKRSDKLKKLDNRQKVLKSKLLQRRRLLKKYGFKCSQKTK